MTGRSGRENHRSSKVLCLSPGHGAYRHSHPLSFGQPAHACSIGALVHLLIAILDQVVTIAARLCTAPPVSNRTPLAYPVQQANHNGTTDSIAVEAFW